MPISKDQLAEWKALAQAATEGPWYCTADGGRSPDEVLFESGPRELLRDVEVWTVGDRSDEENWSTDGGIASGYGMKYADAQFAAESRQALPALIAEVERLTEALQGIADGACGGEDCDYGCMKAAQKALEGKD